MATENSGIIVKTNKDEYGILYHKDQMEEFKNKVLVTIFEDATLTKQVIENGKPKKVLKSPQLLTVIGYSD